MVFPELVPFSFPEPRVRRDFAHEFGAILSLKSKAHQTKSRICLENLVFQPDSLQNRVLVPTNRFSISELVKSP